MKQSDMINKMCKDCNIPNNIHLSIVKWFMENNVFLADMNKVKASMENLVKSLQGDGV